MKSEAGFSLNGLHLKCIGWIFTLCTVAAYAFFPADSDSTVKWILTIAGNISLPIFAFLLVEGFAYTQNRERYALILLAAAVLTEPFYDYVCNGTWFSLNDANGQNILFAMVFGMIQLFFLHYIGTGSVFRRIFCVVAVICSAIWTFMVNIPGGVYFATMVGVFYLLHEREGAMFVLGGFFSLLQMVAPVLAIPVLYFYNGERGSYNKYIFYAAFPMVWIVAALIKFFLI